MPKLILERTVLLVLAVALCGVPACAPRPSSADRILASAYEQQLGGLQVVGSGRVTRLLPDDTNGGRHQRFILQLESGQTLLVAHNIDVARRIDSLAPGDAVRFCGVYEWNDQGGVIHWTHRDPEGSHQSGWLDHRGVRYQ